MLAGAEMARVAKTAEASALTLSSDDVSVKLAMRQLALDEVAATITSLKTVCDDLKANSSARVMASRALLEMAGVIGKDRPIPTRVVDKPIHEMTSDELRETIYNGERARFRIVVIDALRRGDIDLAIAILTDQRRPQPMSMRLRR
jgi:hypothetical protein